MKYLSSVLILSACIATSAVAAESPFYAGVRVGSTNNEIQDVKERSAAYGIFGGYRLVPNLAVEAGYTNLGSMASGNLKISTMELSGVGFIPVSEPFSFYVKLGVARTAAEVTGLTVNRTIGTLGLGGYYKASPKFGVRIGLLDVYGFGDENTAIKQGASIYSSVSGVYNF